MKKLILIISIILSISFLSAQAKMNAKVRSVPEEITKAVFEKPKDNLPALVKNLVGKSSDTSTKVKIIHDWICDNIAYDTDMYFSGRVSKQDYVSVLKKKKAVCSGYTNLMNEMCALAGIESIGIEGWSKGFGYNGQIEKNTTHAWNAVKFGNTWKLIDVTWDAGFVNYKTFIKKYSNDWYCLKTEYFLYSHLPEKDEYQFVKEENLKTKEDFVKEPYVAGVFFTYGLDFKGTMPNYTTIISEPVKYEFTQSKSGVSVNAGLRFKNNKGDVECATWTDKKGSTFSSYFDVPDKGEYQALLFARYTGQDSFGDNFPINQFERRILPGVDDLLANKKITKPEYDHFVNAFFKVEDSGRYYLYDDTLATNRNAAIKKICKLLELNPYMSEVVLSFNIKSDGEYEGFGTGILKYPDAYVSYLDSSGIELVSPLTGVLIAGETYDFAIRSTSFTAFAVQLDGKLELLKKNSETGNFELSVTIPETDKFSVYGSKGGKSYSGLFFYKVE